MGKAEKLLDQARGHLEAGEPVLVSVVGTYETKLMGSDTVRTGMFIATDRRLVFYAKKLGGYDFESFPYPNISSFEQGKNLMGHQFSFFASGNKVAMKWIKESRDFASFARIVTERAGRKDTPAATAAATRPADSPPPTGRRPEASEEIFDQLRKLGELRDAGVLTEDEFTAKKTELLGRL